MGNQSTKVRRTCQKAKVMELALTPCVCQADSVSAWLLPCLSPPALYWLLCDHNITRRGRKDPTVGSGFLWLLETRWWFRKTKMLGKPPVSRRASKASHRQLLVPVHGWAFLRRMTEGWPVTGYKTSDRWSLPLEIRISLSGKAHLGVAVGLKSFWICTPHASRGDGL